MTEKAGVERENEMLHQLLLYYEHMYMREENIIAPFEEPQDATCGKSCIRTEWYDPLNV